MRSPAEHALTGASAARLLIHPAHADAAGAPMRGWLTRARALLGTWTANARGAHAEPPACVRIDDLHGRCHFSADLPSRVIDVALPAGTYHITLRLGALQRRYTVTLGEGTAVDLELPLTADATAWRP